MANTDQTIDYVIKSCEGLAQPLRLQFRTVSSQSVRLGVRRLDDKTAEIEKLVFYGGFPPILQVRRAIRVQVYDEKGLGNMMAIESVEGLTEREPTGEVYRGISWNTWK